MKRTLYDEMLAKIEHNKKHGKDENIGKTVGNSTLLVEEIGRGAMGAVYLGYDSKLDRQVAVKVLLKEMFADERQFDLLKRLLVQEGRSLAKVKHKGVVEVHELDDKFPALIMELIENGEDLHNFLYRKRSEWGTTGFRLWFLSIMEQIAFALGAAHSQGVVHKDLKFSNVMIYKDIEGEWRVKVIDFGLAQNLTRIKLSHGTVLLGTPSYMAPEQWDDHWSLDARADVYSFGAMLYEVLMQGDFQESNDHAVIKANAKDSMFVQRKVGHLPIDQRTPFEFMLAVEKSKRAGGMLEVVGVLRNLRLAITYRDREAPGTSFQSASEAAALVPAESSSHKMAEAAEAAFEENLMTPPPAVPIASPARPEKPKRFDKTMMGHAGMEASAVPADSMDISVSEFDSPESTDVVDPAELEVGKSNNKAIWITVAITAFVFIVGIPLSYHLIHGADKKPSDNDVAPESTYMAPRPKVMAPKPLPIKPVKPAPVVKKTDLPPKPPQLGELPSLKYTVHLFKQEDEWCRKNDAKRAEFEKMPLWRAWCLRRKAMQMYQRDRENPQVAIAFLDEVNAHMCFWEMLFRQQGKYKIKDPSLTKECGTIKNLIYKRFTYYLQGERFKKIDKYLQGRASHRKAVREAWKKTHP